MIKKLFFFDVETSGTDPRHHEILQFACIVRHFDEGRLIDVPNDTFTVFVRPDYPDRCDPTALAVNNLTLDILDRQGVNSFIFYANLIDFLWLHIDKYNKNDKFFPVGFNVGFDYQFLAEFFKRKDDSFFGSWFNHRMYDAMHTARILSLCDIPPFSTLEHFKLTDCTSIIPCALLPTGNVHDALFDIKATMALFQFQISIIARLKDYTR